MKISADWREVTASIPFAILVAAICSVHVLKRFGYEASLTSMAFAALPFLLLFLWPFIRDITLALYNVMSIRKPLPNPSAKRLAGSPSLRAARPNRLLRAP